MKRKKISGSCGIGGQAVLEGVMMKNKDDYAVAVRKPNGEIEVEVEVYRGLMHDSSLTKVPFIRGVFNFADSLRLGVKTLNYSASFYEDEEAGETKLDKALNKVSGGRAENILMGITTIISILLAVGIFILLPYFLSSLLNGYVRNASLLAIIEGAIRIVIFLAYVAGISMMKDIHRLYQYHGAEHKCINCIERGHALTVKNVMRSSRIHKRCGTSFLFFVMFVSIILFFFIRVSNPALKVLLRIVLIPVIAGISYEIIRLAGRSNNIFIQIISAPGMMLQRLTTKEPDESMVEVAMRSVEAVFDWRAYLKENFGTPASGEVSGKKKAADSGKASGAVKAADKEVSGRKKAVSREEVSDRMQAADREEESGRIKAAGNEEVSDRMQAVSREEVSGRMKAAGNKEVSERMQAASNEEVSERIKAADREETADSAAAEIDEDAAVEAYGKDGE